MEASKGQERSIMKVRIELDPSMDEPEILIRVSVNTGMAQLQELVLKQKLVPLALQRIEANIFWIWQYSLLKQTGKRFLDIPDELYEVKQKLNELEELSSLLISN